MDDNSFDAILQKLENGENPTPPVKKGNESETSVRKMSSPKQKKDSDTGEDDGEKNIFGMNSVVQRGLDLSNFGILPVARGALDKSGIGIRADVKGIKDLFSLNKK